MVQIQPGFYLHYKGKYYQVFGEAVHSETREIYVLYKPTYELSLEDDEYNRYAIRPKTMFLGNVMVNGETKQRFLYVGPELPTEKEVDHANR